MSASQRPKPWLHPESGCPYPWFPRFALPLRGIRVESQNVEIVRYRRDTARSRGSCAHSPENWGKSLKVKVDALPYSMR